DENEAPLNAAVAGDEAVSVIFLLRQSEIVCPVGDKSVCLLERAFIKQELDALARRHLAFFVLALAAFLASAFVSELVAAFQLLDFFLKVHGRDYRRTVVGRRQSCVGSEIPLPKTAAQHFDFFCWSRLCRREREFVGRECSAHTDLADSQEPIANGPAGTPVTCRC